MLDLARLGQNIRFQRIGRGWSLADLETHSKVPKAYLSDLENNKGGKPNIQYLFQIAEALNSTIDALIHGEKTPPVEESGPSILPPGLLELAQEEKLTDPEVRMLAALNFRGSRPRDKASWKIVYDVIKLASKQ